MRGKGGQMVSLEYGVRHGLAYFLVLVGKTRHLQDFGLLAGPRFIMLSFLKKDATIVPFRLSPKKGRVSLPKTSVKPAKKTKLP